MSDKRTDQDKQGDESRAEFWDPGSRACPEEKECLVLRVDVKVTQSSPTLSDPMDYAVHGILQARILEWVAVPSSRESSQLRE